MPVIVVDGPPVADIEVKRRFAQALTEAACEAYGLPEQAMVVIMKENSAENVASGGQLIADRHAEVGTS